MRLTVLGVIGHVASTADKLRLWTIERVALWKVETSEAGLRAVSVFFNGENRSVCTLLI